MVTEENNNKYYLMEYDGVGSDFVVKYGRVEKTETVIKKSINEWDSIYKSKVKKGYTDVTHLVAVEVKEVDKDTSPAKLKKHEDKKVEEFIALMKSYTDNLVTETYSVKCDNVSQKQIDEAQSLIDELTKVDKKDSKLVNKKLLALYAIIPRYMSHVKHHLLPEIDLDKAFIQEQDNLDAMASQVALLDAKEDNKKETKKKSKEEKTLLDVMGIKMKEIKSHADIDYLIKQINSGSGYGRQKVEAIFEVDKGAENTRFDKWMIDQKNKSTKILIHGTRCSSVIPIMEQGLKIRPSGNFQFSGKAYGDGNYFSEVVAKSLGYTGSNRDKILLVYEVHTGNPFVYNGWYTGNDFSLNYTELQKRGFDSTHT